MQVSNNSALIEDSGVLLVQEELSIIDISEDCSTPSTEVIAIESLSNLELPTLESKNLFDSDENVFKFII